MRSSLFGLCFGHGFGDGLCGAQCSGDVGVGIEHEPEGNDHPATKTKTKNTK